MVSTRAVDVLQPDVCYVGGFTRALRVASLAAAAGLPCTPHYPWQVGMYEPRPEVVSGRVRVPEGPGWGVEVSPEWLARSEHRISSID